MTKTRASAISVSRCASGMSGSRASLTVDVLELVEVRNVVRRRHEEHRHRPVEGGAADLAQLEAGRGRGELAEVGEKLLVVDQVAVGARRETEEGVGRGRSFGQEWGSRGQNEGGEGQDGEQSTHGDLHRDVVGS